MPFDCDTAQIGIEPFAHYRECGDLVMRAWNFYLTNPPIELNPLVSPFNIWMVLVAEVGTNCTAAWNGIEAAGTQSEYDPQWLAELRQVCAAQLQPAAEWICWRMSNDGETFENLSTICGLANRFRDPNNVGYPEIANPFVRQADGSP